MENHELRDCSSPSLSAPAHGRCIAQDEKPAAEELELSSMPVEDSYDGPMMEGKDERCPRSLLMQVTEVMCDTTLP